jgi:hypothetical protein
LRGFHGFDLNSCWNLDLDKRPLLVELLDQLRLETREGPKMPVLGKRDKSLLIYIHD